MIVTRVADEWPGQEVVTASAHTATWRPNVKSDKEAPEMLPSAERRRTGVDSLTRKMIPHSPFVARCTCIVGSPVRIDKSRSTTTPVIMGAPSGLDSELQAAR